MIIIIIYYIFFSSTILVPNYDQRFGRESKRSFRRRQGSASRSPSELFLIYNITILCVYYCFLQGFHDETYRKRREYFENIATSYRQ